MKKNKKQKVLTILIFAVSLFLFIPLANASVECSFPSGLDVAYTAGVPNPTSSSCILEIENEEGSILTVNSVTINSTSMTFQNVGSGWTCNYTETSATPNLTGQTVCTPNNPLTVNVGETSSFTLTFSFEDFSGVGGNLPNNLALSMRMNGTIEDHSYTELGSSSWSVVVEGNTDPSDDKNEDCSGSIGNTIWLDLNKNGIKENREAGIGGVKVCAYRGNSKECDKTNSQGRYKIENLCKGHYDVRVKKEGVKGLKLVYDPDGKLDHKTEVKLKNDNDKHTKADFGYVESLVQTGKELFVFKIVLFFTLLILSVSLTFWGWKLRNE